MCILYSYVHVQTLVGYQGNLMASQAYSFHILLMLTTIFVFPSLCLGTPLCGLQQLLVSNFINLLISSEVSLNLLFVCLKFSIAFCWPFQI